MFMEPLVDDIGSFPLPKEVSSEVFSRAYRSARDAIVSGKDPFQDEFVRKNFCDVIINSFRLKFQAGLDVINYPQHYDGLRQAGDVIHKAMESGTFVIPEREAFLPEVEVIKARAKELSEEFGKKIFLRVSLFGPMEQYLKEIGTTPYNDVLEGFAETIRRFCKNSIVDEKYLKTEVVSIDEPSFGFLNINSSNDLYIKILNKAFDFGGAIRQIHLHSTSRLADLLAVENIDVFTFEYAASPKNIASVSKPMLDAADKGIRVGISRTDVDAITSELNDQGITNPTIDQLAESEDTIRKRYNFAKARFGDRMTFTGPDCGLNSWPSQEAAQLLLKRTVNAVKKL